MSVPFVFGLELECALAIQGSGCQGPLLLQAYELIRKAICTRVPWLHDLGEGVFTPGFRFYLDSGMHPEVALVETSSPHELLALKSAALRLIGAALDEAALHVPGLMLLANNHDYLEGTYWGCHENYALRRAPGDLAAGMLPFLATRVLFAGNGWIDRHGCLWFSTRAGAMERETGGETTNNRALYSTCRNEPHARKGPLAHRLHLICGDTLLSPYSEYLRVATTALVLAWLEREPAGATQFHHREPLALLRSANCFWLPPGRLTISAEALALQRAYHDRVARFVAGWAERPCWCDLALVHWAETLDCLEHDPFRLVGRLDPFTKLSIFDTALQTLGRSWAEIAHSRKLFSQLAMLDVNCHRVGYDGPFQQLAAAGSLGAPGPPPTDEPMATIVSRLATRAAARAALITQMTGRDGLRCNWDALWRRDPPGVVDLPDPACPTVPDWQAAEPGKTTLPPPTMWPRGLRRVF